MPRSAIGCALVIATASFIVDGASAEEDCASATEGAADAGATGFTGDTGQDHSALSLSEAGTEQCEIKGQDHVSFATGSADPVEGDKGCGHVDIAAGDDMGDSHVDFAVDPAGAYAVEAYILPGGDGAEVCGCVADPAAAVTDSAADKGEDHVDSHTDGASPATGDDQGQDHVNFSTAATDPAADHKGDGHVDFRVAVRPDGSVEVNGQQVAVCDPTDGCRIIVSWFPGVETLVVRVENTAGVVCAGQYPISGTPDRVEITAGEVRSLAVQRQ